MFARADEAFAVSAGEYTTETHFRPQKAEADTGFARPYGDYAPDKIQVDMDDIDELGEDEDEKQQVVVIPRYSGSTNTRVDFYPLEHGRFKVTGMQNHTQMSCVYLRLSGFKIEFEKNPSTIFVNQNGLLFLEFPPFFIQRLFSRMNWSTQTCGNQFDPKIREQLKLLPYICDKDLVEKESVVKFSLDTNHTSGNFELTVDAYEPLLGFQSGWAKLGAKRPFNQQGMYYPLAIQDYELQIEEPTYIPIQDLIRTSSRYGFRDDSFVNEQNYSIISARAVLDDEPITGTTTASLNVTHQAHSTGEPEKGKIELVAFSEKDAKQENKSVSDIMLHAPELIVYEKQVAFSHTAGNNNRANTLDTVISTTDDGIPKMIHEINTAEGFPSFIMLYLELDQKYHHDIPGSSVVGANIINGAQPKIVSIRISFFGNDVPIVKNLSEQELQYITRKNCHPNSMYETEKYKDPIVLLDLESLGLCGEDFGYPVRKRVDFKVEVTQFQLPFRYRYLRFEPAYTANVRINFKTVMVYENNVLEGNYNHMRFVRKY